MNRQKHIQHEISKALSIKAEEYNMYMFEIGMAYLNKYLNYDKKLIKDFAYSAAFWKWWNRQYSIVDELCIFNEIYDINIYKKIHLNIEVRIDRVVWKIIESKRDKMIQRVIKNSIKNDRKYRNNRNEGMQNKSNETIKKY